MKFCIDSFLFAIFLQSSFFAHFMCFDVPALVSPGVPSNIKRAVLDGDDVNDDLGIMDPDEGDTDISILLSSTPSLMFFLST